MVIRRANPTDAAAIADLVNAAYQVELFFVEGDRTSGEEVRSLMSRGTFLVGVTNDDEIIGSVLVGVSRDCGTFGMLAVAPSAQRVGFGHRLIAQAERHAASLGASVMEIRVVNLRADLLPRYERLGYVATGTEPYVHRPVIRPCHFIVMSKPLPARPAR